MGDKHMRSATAVAHLTLVLAVSACVPLHLRPTATPRRAGKATPTAAAEAAQAPWITEIDAARAYQAYAPAEKQLSEEAYVWLTSLEYRSAEDEFTRARARKSTLANVEADLADARTERRLRTLVRFRLPEYDFNRGGFPTDFGAGSFVELGERSTLRPRHPLLGIVFTNGAELSFIEISEDQASLLSRRLERDRTALLEVEFLIRGVGDDLVGINTTTKTLVAEALWYRVTYGEPLVHKGEALPIHNGSLPRGRVILGERTLQPSPKPRLAADDEPGGDEQRSTP